MKLKMFFPQPKSDWPSLIPLLDKASTLAKRTAYSKHIHLFCIIICLSPTHTHTHTHTHTVKDLSSTSIICNSSARIPRMTLTPRMKENSRLPKEYTVFSSQYHIRLTFDLSFLARVHAQSCPTLYKSVDSSLPGFSVHGILQARILEWVVISFSRASSRPGDQTCISYDFCVGTQVLYPLNC